MRKTLSYAVLAVGGLLFAACGGSGDPSPDDAQSTPPAASFPVTVTGADGRPLTINERPERIVSLAPTPTEMLFAIGAGEQVVAVDALSNYPAEAPRTDLAGFEPNIEAIAGYEPDLVVLTDDIEDVVAGLTRLGIPTLHLPAAQTIEDTYAQIETLGTATGHRGEAAATTEQMRRDIESITDALPARDAPLSFYHELDDLLYTVTSDTFIGQLYELVGLQNVADAADTQGSGYPRLSPEYLLMADPDLIFLADTKCCGQNAQTLAGRPGFADLSAVRQGQVIELDDDVASRWGPRVVDFLRIIAEAVEQSPVPAG